MPLSKEEKTFTFEQKLAVTKYNDLLAEIGLEDTNYVVWAYEDAKAVKSTKLTNTQSVNVENETKKVFPKYYICNKAKQYCKRCGQSFANDEIVPSKQTEVEVIHFRHITHDNREIFEPVLLGLTCNVWRCHACYDLAARPQYKITRDDNSSLLGAAGKQIFTKDCKNFIATRALYMEQKALANIFGINDVTVRDLLIDKIKTLDNERCWDNIQTLGIYTVCVGEKTIEYCLCTNVEEETFIEWFPWSNHTMANDFAEKLQLCKRNIRRILTSIDDKACGFAASNFPEIKRQIDRVDVKERLLKAMKNVCRKEAENIPKEIRPSVQAYWPLLEKDGTEVQGHKIRTINNICNKYESIGSAYNLKELGYDIYRQATGQEQLVDGWIAADKHCFQPFKRLEKQMADNRDGVIKFAEQSYGLPRERYEHCLLEILEPLDKYRTLNIEKTMKEVAQSATERIANSKGITDENGTTQKTVKEQVSTSIKSKAGVRFNPKTERGMLLYGIALRYNARQTANRIFEELQMKMMDFTAAKFGIPGKNKYITLHNFGIPLAEMGDWLNIACEFESVDLSVGMQDYWNCASRKKVLSDIGSAEKIPWGTIFYSKADRYAADVVVDYDNWIPIGGAGDKCSFFNTDGMRGIFSESGAGTYDVPIECLCQRKEIEQCKMVMLQPFYKEYLYICDETDEQFVQWEKVFPAEEYENRVICVSKTKNEGVNVLMTRMIPDYNLFPDIRCFPLYVYDKVENEKPEEQEESGQLSFDDIVGEKTIWARHSAISDDMLDRFKEVYDDAITKEDIFYYVYAVLHSPYYNKICADNADNRLPRIPMLKHFMAYAKIGRALADVHLNYDKQVRPEELGVIVDRREEYVSVDYSSKAIHFGRDKSVIKCNSNIEIRNIPEKTYDYIVNGKSPTEWVLDRYVGLTREKEDIINELNNLYGNVVDLLMSAISVSLKTQTLIEQLP